jgi:hypothetical protein
VEGLKHKSRRNATIIHVVTNVEKRIISGPSLIFQFGPKAYTEAGFRVSDILDSQFGPVKRRKNATRNLQIIAIFFCVRHKRVAHL